MALRTTLISGFGINTERSHYFLPSTFTFCSEHAILACALIWMWPITKVRSLFSWRTDFQQAPWCASAEAGAAGFAGDTFPFVLTQTHHHVKDTGSRAEPFHPRCWPFVLLTELAHLYMVMCCFAVCEHHTEPSPLVSAGCSPLHGSELSCSPVCVVTTTAAHWHVPAEPRRDTRLLRCREHIHSPGFVEVACIYFLSQIQCPSD